MACSGRDPVGGSVRAAGGGRCGCCSPRRSSCCLARRGAPGRCLSRRRWRPSRRPASPTRSRCSSRSSTPATRACAPVLTALLEDRLCSRKLDDQKIVIAVSADEALSTLRADRSGVAAGRGHGAARRARRRSAPTIGCAASCASPSRGSRWPVPTRGAARRGPGDDALARRASDRAPARAGAEETDPAVKYEIDTGLALATLDGDDPSERLAAIATLVEPAPPEVRNRLAALIEPSVGRQLRRGRRRRPPCGAGGGAKHRQPAPVLCRRRNAVLRPEPRLGAGAGRDRSGDHLRRHGRHQHGARRADDARRLHHLRRAAADAEPHRRLDPGRRFPPPSWFRRPPAS